MDGRSGRCRYRLRYAWMRRRSGHATVCAAEKQKDYQGKIGFLSRRFVTEHRLRGVFFLGDHVTKSLLHAVVLDFLFQTP